MFSVVVGFLVLITLIFMKVSIVVAAPLSSAIIAILNNLNILEVLNNYYLPGFAEFVQNYFFIFILSYCYCTNYFAYFRNYNCSLLLT